MTSEINNMTQKLVDIHSHILPYIDDGADDWESSLTMLSTAEKEGIVAIVATPHILHNNDYKLESRIISTHEELCQRARDAGLKIKIHLGLEFFYSAHGVNKLHFTSEKRVTVSTDLDLDLWQS